MENPPQYHGVNLYVKNFSPLMDDNSLFAVFSAYGTIISAKIMRHDDGTSKGFGFVCFANDNDAIKAIEELNGSIIANKPIYVALFEPKKIRQEKLSSRYAEYERDAAEHNIPWQPQPRGTARGRSRGILRGTTRGRGRFLSETEPLELDSPGVSRSLPVRSMYEPVQTGPSRGRGSVQAYPLDMGHEPSHLSNGNTGLFGATALPVTRHFTDPNAGYEPMDQFLSRRSLPNRVTGESMGRVLRNQLEANQLVRNYLANEHMGYERTGLVRGEARHVEQPMRGATGYVAQPSLKRYQYRTDNL